MLALIAGATITSIDTDSSAIFNKFFFHIFDVPPSVFSIQKTENLENSLLSHKYKPLGYNSIDIIVLLHQ